MRPRSTLEINLSEDPFREARCAKLVLKENSKFICCGHIQLFEAVKIECLENSRLEIGSRTYLNHDTMVRCKKQITIGNNCAIAYGVLIQDSDFHSIFDSEGNERESSRPILIQDNVWIGANAIILKGVTIGEGAIVAAGAVVVKDVPSHSLVAGNPAKVVKTGISHS